MKDIFLTLLEISAGTSVLIIGVMLLSAVIDKKFTPKWKYWIWLLIALRLIVPFNPEFDFAPKKIEVAVPDRAITAENWNAYPESNFTDINDNISAQPSTGSQNGAQTENTENTVSTEPKYTVTMLDAAAAVWIGGGVLFLIWNAVSYYSFKRRIAAASRPADPEGKCAAVLEEIKAELEIGGEIEFAVCKGISSPMVMGFLKPKLLLPSEDYGEDELKFILRHELTHFKRHDTFYKAFLLLANAVHWFNPVVWLMRKKAGADLELSCDAEVVAGADMETRRRYSETILASVHREKAVCGALSTHFYGGKNTLKKRFANIFNMEKKRVGKIAFAAVLVIGVVFGGMVACNADAGAPSNEEVRELIQKAQAVYQPGDNSILDITAYEVFIDPLYYDEIGNFDEAAAEIFSEKGIEQIKNTVTIGSEGPVFLEQDGKIYRYSCMTDSDITVYYSTVTSVTLAEQKDGKFIYEVVHLSLDRYGEQEEYTSYIIIVKENGKYLVESFDSKRFKVTEESEDTEKSNEEKLADEIYNSELWQEYITLINERITSYKDGTFEEVENHHRAYPEDFPSLEKAVWATEQNIALAWRAEYRVGNAIYEGALEYIVCIDETHLIVLEPVTLILANGKEIVHGFGNTAYVDTEEVGLDSIEKWMKKMGYDGYYGNIYPLLGTLELRNIAEMEGKFTPIDPVIVPDAESHPLIAEHVALLNAVLSETYGVQYKDTAYNRYYSASDTDHSDPIGMVPDGKDYSATFQKYGYVSDPADVDCYPVLDFSTKDELREYLGNWLSPDIYNSNGMRSIDSNFIEFEGRLFLARGGRGYGVEGCSHGIITYQADVFIKAEADYYYQGELAGKVYMTFMVDGDEIILSSYQIREEKVKTPELSGTPLTAEEINRVSEAFVPFILKDGVSHINPPSLFFASYYDRPEEMDITDFLLYFDDELITEESEFEELKEVWASYGYTVPEGTTIEDYPVPLHKIRRSKVNERLMKYMGITVEELENFDMDYLAEYGIYYMEKYDCFYTTTSDGLGVGFNCVAGEKFEDGTVVLYGNMQNMLVLEEQPDGSYHIIAHKKIA